jgi:ABC-2 type transport system permease protein
MANPVAEAVLLMQKCFWWGVVPQHSKNGNTLIEGGQRSLEFPPDLYVRGVVMLVVCACLLVAAQKFFSRVENRFPERM